MASGRPCSIACSIDSDGTRSTHDDNWIHELNLDPRHRVAGGFGGDVVRRYQEDYMEAAWLQVGDVLAHNQKARVARTWVVVSEAMHAKSIAAACDHADAGSCR